ncbi:MAG: hypothetical protein CEN90_733 [Parcubacteria group bacterium Licking1014_17]|nr:MAG: hypothetical protein CEN90_733 [Parcubacteria group bacterium Licking1014_17]
MGKKLRKVIPLVAAFAVCAIPAVVLALTAPTSPVEGSGGWTLDMLGTDISRVGQFAIIFGVIVAVIFIVWGGVTYMMAGGNPESEKKAKTRIWNGLIGAAIVLGVGIILSTISALVSGSFFEGGGGGA